MNIIKKSSQLSKNLELKIDTLVSANLCKELIRLHESNPASSKEISTKIDQIEDIVFGGDLDHLLKQVYPSDYHILCRTLDVVDSAASAYNPSTRWHLDHGIPGTLKLFIYLNNVSEHQGNTLIIDLKRTAKLKVAGELPLDFNERTEDLEPVLKKMKLDSNHLAYDLAAGDALLFDPLTLAHRCLPPQAGKKRYSLCFTITPPI